MDHPLDAHVVDELESAGRQRRQIDPRDGGAEHRPVAGGLALRGRVEGQLESPPGHQLAVADATRGIGTRADRAIDGHQLVGRQPESRRGQPHQRLSRGGGGKRQVAMVEVGGRRLAARSRPLIRRPRGVALHEPHARGGHRQLLGHELHLRGRHPLAELALAGVRRHHAVGVDADPRIEPAGIHAGRAPRARLRRDGRGAVQVEAHDQAAGAGQELPSRHAHGRAPARLAARSA